MLIGNQYSDKKMYRGINFYDGKPLMSGDIHEYEDTASKKTSYLMNNLLGYGTINSPQLLTSPTSIKLVDPSVVMIDGDIVLISNDENNSIVESTDLTSMSNGNYTLCAIGWYQAISHNSTLRAYGGIKNSQLPNDIWNQTVNSLVSSRYQFRWMPVIIETDNLEDTSFAYDLPITDATGAYSGDTTSCTFSKDDHGGYTTNCPESMDFSLSDLYMIPILNFTYSNPQITAASPVNPMTVGGGFISSLSEPEGTYPDGTVWYNSVSSKFKYYVSGEGWVSQVSELAYLQYQSVYTFASAITTAQDIVVPIGIAGFSEDDGLQVVYEGLTLTPTTHYTTDYADMTITLLGFTAQAGDMITFTSYRVVDASSPSQITSTLNSHMATRGTNAVEGHLKLSDLLSDSNDRLGVAATPKLVKDTVESLQEDIEEEIALLYGPENIPSSSTIGAYNKEEVDELLSGIEDTIPTSMIATNITVQSSAYVSDATYADYPYKASVPIQGVTSSMVPIVTYSVADVLSGIHCPVASTGTNKIDIYASETPTAAVTITSILIQGGTDV